MSESQAYESQELDVVEGAEKYNQLTENDRAVLDFIYRTYRDGLFTEDELVEDINRAIMTGEFVIPDPLSWFKDAQVI